MKIISWNLNSRSNTAILSRQCDYLLEGNFDIITLQEISTRSEDFIKRTLRDKGGYFLVSSFDLADDHSILKGRRKFGEIIASRFRFSTNDPNQVDIPYPERVLSVRLTEGYLGLDIHTTHVPPGSTNGVIKVEHFEGLYRFLTKNLQGIRILTGDFNSPQAEHINLGVVTWGQRILSSNRLKYYIKPLWRNSCTAERWDAAERNIIENVDHLLLYDVFRSSLSNDNGEGYSWIIKRNGRLTKRRYDHIFASKSIKTVNCYYDQEPRDHGLSDHSPVIAEFDL